MRSTDSVVRKKAEVQSRGVRVQPELIRELETSYNAPAIRTGRMVLCFQSPGNGREPITTFVVNGKRVATSPLHLVKNCAGRYEIWADNEKYADVTLIPHPQFYEKVTGNGVPMNKLAVIVGPGHLRSIVHQECFYHQTGRPCRFCAVQHWWDANLYKNLSDIAEVVWAGIKEGLIRHISLTTATLGTKGKGLEDLVETAKLIRAKAEVPIMLEFEPVEDYAILDGLLKEAKKAGVTTISCNIECFDEKLRPKIMPAKGKLPIATYIETWRKALDIFGANQVFTVAVVGLGETDKTILQGIEMAASHGVMTFLVPHSPAIGAEYEDMASPSADRMLSLYEQAVDIYGKHGLDLTASKAGCVRGGSFSAITDVARFGAG